MAAPQTRVLDWLLGGDVSVQFQTLRDLHGQEKPALRQRIATEGWGRRILLKRRSDGHWGREFYQPKWISTHYTLLDLKNLQLPTKQREIAETLRMVVATEKAADGGIYPIGAGRQSDICVNGMFLNYACYFRADERQLKSVVDLLLSEKMPDGGFNCLSNRKGARHSSLHSTLSVLEGFLEYERAGYAYRLRELRKARGDAHEFILMHRLFRSDKTGAVINAGFLKFYYPCRWYYDILRALDYFRLEGAAYDQRMADAIRVVLDKRGADGTWKLAAKHPGQTHFDMEQAGKPSRWNTLRALRVLRHFGEAEMPDITRNFR